MTARVRLSRCSSLPTGLKSTSSKCFSSSPSRFTGPLFIATSLCSIVGLSGGWKGKQVSPARCDRVTASCCTHLDASVMRRWRARRQRNCFRYLLTLRGVRHDYQVSGKRRIGESLSEEHRRAVPFLRLPREPLRAGGEGSAGGRRQHLVPEVAGR